MTLPRLLPPGATVMITRRTLRRTCLLRPDPQLSELYRYCLGVAANRFGIQVHAATLMSTHEHLIVTDPHGRLPCFLRELHRLVALGVKVLRKWEGAVWDHEPTSVVELLTPEAVVEKLAYVMANPVVAGLVPDAAQWPGVRTLPNDLGRATWTARRPKVYFTDHDDAWPPEVSLALTLPPTAIEEPDSFRERVTDELERAQQAARKELAEKGWSFRGKRRVVRTSPYQRATRWEPLRDRNPTFAVGAGQREAFQSAVRRLRAFRQAYREARDQWLKGLRDVIFPYGTWAMQWLHHATVALPF